MSSGGRAAHHLLKLSEAIALSIPPVGSVLQPVVKCGALSTGQGILGSRIPNHWTFVLGHCLEPVPLPQVIIGGWMHLTSGLCSLTVWSCIANRSFDSSRAAIDEGR